MNSYPRSRIFGAIVGFVLVPASLLQQSPPSTFAKNLQTTTPTNAAPTDSVRLIISRESVGEVPLGTPATEAAAILPQTTRLRNTRTGRSEEYEGQTVTYHYFGNERDGEYPLETYSSDRGVFLFEINSTLFATPEGIEVGSSEAELQQAYPNLRSRNTREGMQYSLDNTDFVVEDGTVTQIIVRTR